MVTDFKKLLMAGTAIILVLAPVDAKAVTVVINGVDAVIGVDPAATPAIQFATDNIADVTGGVDITGTVVTNTDLTGTLTFSGATTVSAAVGAIGKAIKVVNAGVGGIVSFGSNVDAGTVNITGVNAVNFGGYVTGAVTFGNNDGTITIADTKNVNGTVDSTSIGLGTFTVSGSTTVSGAVGGTAQLKALNVGAIGSTSNFTGTVAATTINITGIGAVNFNSTVGADSVAFAGAGTVAFNGALTLVNDINFNDQDATVILGTAIGLTKNIDNLGAIANKGTLTLAGGVQAITGNVGATQALNVVNAGITGGTATFAGTVDTATINVTQTGNVTFSGITNATNVNFQGAGVLTFEAAVTGAVDFADNDGFLTLRSGISLANNIDNSAGFGSKGTLTLEGGVQTITGTVGATQSLKVVNAGAAVAVSTFTGTVNAATINVTGTGTVAFSDSVTGNVSFGGDGLVTLASGKSLTGTVDTVAPSTGSLTLSGGVQTVSGAVGVTNSLLAVTAGAAAATSNFSAAVKADTVSVGGAGSTSNFATTVTATTVNLTDTGTANFTGAVTATNVNLAGTGTVNFNGGLTGALNYNAAGGIVNVADTFAISGVTAVTTTGTGQLTLAGSSIMPSTIGALGLSLGTLDVGAAASTSTFAADVYATNFNLTSTGTANFTGALNSTTISLNGDGIINFNGNVAGVINGTGGIVGAGVGTVNFAANATGVTSIGTGGVLKAMTLSGNATTLTVAGGNVNAADTINLANNIIDITGGSFTMGAAQVMNIDVVGTTSGQVRASVAPTLNAASSVVLTIDPNNYVPDGQVFTLVDDLTNAGGGIPVIDFTASNTAMMTFTQDLTNTNDLVVTVARKQLKTFTTGLNPSNVATALDALGTGGDATLDTIQLNLQAAGNIGDTATITNILDSLVSNADGGVVSSNLNLGSMTQGINEGRIATIRLGGEDFYEIDNSTGVSAGDPVAPDYYSAWIQGYGQSSVQKTYTNYSGYKSNIMGAVMGFDTTELFEDTIFGVSLAVGQTQVKSRNVNKTESDITNYGLNIYSNYDFNGFMFMDTQVGMGLNSVAARRYNVGGVGGSTALANYNTFQYQAKGVFGVDYWSPTGLIMTPTVSAGYTFLYTEAYRESGAAGAGLDVGGERMSVFDVGAGLNLAYKLRNEESGSYFKPILHASYTYDAIGDTMQNTSNFLGGGGSFTTYGTPIARSRFNGGMGFVYASTTSWAMSMNYDYEYRDKYDAHSGSVRLTTSF